MIEVIKHLTGVCGEHSHPSILTLLASGVGVSGIYSYIKYRYFNKKADKEN